MRRGLLAFLAVGTFFGVVAWSADSARWSALVLHAEPLLLLATAVGAYVALVQRRYAISAGLALGGVAGLVALRIPGVETEGRPGGPAWGRRVQSCASMLSPPEGPVDLLQWTLSESTDAADVLKAVQIIQPDVVVLFDVGDPGLLDAMVMWGGGEAHFHPPEGAGRGVGIYTRGVFHICGDEEEWVEAMDSPGGYAVSFVGVPPDDGTDEVVFPLVVARFPDPLVGSDFDEALTSATHRVAALLGTVDSPELVLVADAPVTSTYRGFLSEIRGGGLVSVPTPPNFPAHMGPVPLLPVHAYDRAWTGPAWTTVASRRVGVDGATRAPVWTRLGPNVRAARAG